MLYFKILMMAVATLAALSVFADGDKSQRAGHARLLIGSSVLFLVAVVIELVTKAMLW